MEERTEIVRKYDRVLGLSGAVEAIDFRKKHGYTLSEINGREMALKFLELCNETGHIRVSNSFECGPDFVPGSQRITNVLYEDPHKTRKVSIPFSEYELLGRPEFLFESTTIKYLPMEDKDNIRKVKPRVIDRHLGFIN